MLTYRRADADQPWHSENFDMRRVYESLRERKVINIGLTEKGLLREYCQGGCSKDEVGGFVTMQDVSAQYFGNLDDWSRMKVIPPPSRLD